MTSWTLRVWNTVGIRLLVLNSSRSNNKQFLRSTSIPIRRWYRSVSQPQEIRASSLSSTIKVAEMSTMVSLDMERTSPVVGGNQFVALEVSPTSTVLRYSMGDERFQLKVILRPNGKVFNFDRAVNEPLQSTIDRMVTNISKKVKTFDGKVAFLLLGSTSDPTTTSCGPAEQVDGRVIIEDFLRDVINNPRRSLQIQIGEEIYEVAVNPPEVHSIKFLKQVDAEYPVVPIKVETSNNFKLESSRYLWEFTSEALFKPIQKKPLSNKRRKNSGGGESQNGIVSDETGTSVWKSTGCTSFVFTPPEDLVGNRLRFTCIPSDGLNFGLPFSFDLPSPVAKSVIQNPLFEERLSRMKTKPKDDLKFARVVSYNCLADTYATEEWFISSPKGCLSADFRLPYLNKELAAYEADLYCLQEVDEKYFEGYFTPFFNNVLQYEGIFSCKVGNTKEGIATFYNPKKFDLLRNETVVILEHMKTQTFWSSISSLSDEFSSRLLDRNTVFQLAVFKPKGVANSIVIVANTHLYFHPDADHIRCLQTLTCVDYIERTVKEIKNTFPSFQVSVLFCGDFNCTPPFSSYRFLTSGSINQDDFDWTSHSSEKLLPGIKREHGLALKNSHPEEELTNITTCFEGCLDYILYQPENFNLLCVYPPPDKTKIASIIGVDEPRQVSLPNFHTPSDHLPLIADFELKQQMS